MGNALWVSIDLDQGAQILRILDESGLKVLVALWVHLEEYTDWRLLLCSKRFDDVGPLEGYGVLNAALAAAGFPMEKKPAVLILPMTDPFVRALRRYFGKAKSVEGTRLGGQTIGNRWVDDAYVYRVS
jgi:hypothetical protein